MDKTTYGIIYIATNTINGKKYIGKTIQNLHARVKNHISKSQSDNTNCIFHNAIRKYDISNFEQIVVCQCLSKEELDMKEIEYIKKNETYIGLKNNKGYNMTLGGDGGHNRFILDKTRKILSENSKKRQKDPIYRSTITHHNKTRQTDDLKEQANAKRKLQLLTHKEQIINTNKRINGNPSTIKKRGASIKKTMNSQEYREKASELRKSDWQKTEYRKKFCKTFLITTPEGDQLIVNDLKHFCASIGVEYQRFHRICGTNKQQNGYTIKHYNGDNNEKRTAD